MADRYLRANGNWNGAVWASTISGSPGSAATPTVNDDVLIYANFTVNLTANAICRSVTHINGGLNLNSYKLTITSSSGAAQFQSTGSTTRSINLGSGTLEMNSPSTAPVVFRLVSTGLSFNADQSLIIFNCNYGLTEDNFITANKTFNDVQINLGAGTANSVTFDITGSPTFRLLDIRSANSVAHTVDFDPGYYQIQKLITIGASSSNRLILKSFTDEPIDVQLDIAADGSSYGQFTDMRCDAGPDTQPPLYIGSNSIQSTVWLTQDPPKISTLVDPLTTTPGSNANWQITGSNPIQLGIGAGGGGYLIGGSTLLTSTDSYDLTESELVFERPAYDPSSGQFGIDALGGLVNSPRVIAAWSEIFYPDDVAYYSLYDTGGGGDDMGIVYPLARSKFVRIKISGSTLTIAGSGDGTTWTVGQSRSLTTFELMMFKSVRIKSDGGSQAVGSINLLPPNNTGAFLQFF